MGERWKYIFVTLEVYSEGRFVQALEKIRELTSADPSDFVPQMRTLCGNAGVAFVVTPELPKSGANGVARWLAPERALIQLGVNWDSADIFWSAFFHEACHVLRHEVKTAHIDGNGDDVRDEKAEAEANQFARALLVEPADWDRFIDAGDLAAAPVRQFAREINIDPGIVVGRLQHEGLIPFHDDAGWFCELNGKVDGIRE